FPDEPDRTYYGSPGQSDQGEEYPFLHQGTMTITCPDPDKFGDERTITVSTADYHEVTGQKSTDWTSRTVFQKDMDSFLILGGNDLNIALNYSFIAGDVLEIDYKHRSVTLNGKDIVTSVNLTTNWIDLPVGNVMLAASHETELTYYERYY